MVCNLMDQRSRSESKSGTSPSFSKDECQLGNKMLNEIFMGCVLRAREEDGHVTWLSRTARTRKPCLLPKSTSKDSHTKQTHMKKLFHFHVRTELSKCSIAFVLTVAKHPLGETALQDEERRGKRRKIYSSKRKTENTSGACVETSSHEVHRSTLFVPKEETFLIRMRYVDVMMQTRTSNDNASRQTLNDCWDAAWGGCTL